MIIQKSVLTGTMTTYTYLHPVTTTSCSNSSTDLHETQNIVLG